jgi:AhpD family alkylhydroperoxidase
MTMSPRLNPFATSAKLMQMLAEFGTTVVNSGLEKNLTHLVKIRASQINGCAVCLGMHTREARQSGETEERLFMLDAWRETSLYTERERAALAWTDALTLVASTHAPDDVYQQVKAQFNEEEQVQLTLLIGVINSYNRLGVGFRLGPPAKAQRDAA